MSTTPIDNNSRAPVTVRTLRHMKEEGEKIVMLTAYDASFAHVLAEAGVDIVLVGDSLGMVVQGHDTTVPVSVDDMVYHTRCVAARAGHMLIMADMPFMSFRDPVHALDNATRLMQEGGAHMVKLEGAVTEVVAALARQGIPVCGHLGLQPQSIHKLGGYRVQGRDSEAAAAMREDALRMQDAGADMILLECVPVDVAREISEELAVPTIGIGAGPHCDGQVLVLQDLLGITPGRRPRFAQDFLGESTEPGGIPAAIARYVAAVKDGRFPDASHSFE